MFQIIGLGGDETPVIQPEHTEPLSPSPPALETDISGIETIGQPTLMPLTDQIHKGIEAGNKSSDNFKGIVYSRKNKIQGKDNSTMQQCHESDLRTNQHSNHEAGKTLPESSPPCSISQSKSLDDLDIPIAYQKGVKSCTKHLMSNFVSYLQCKNSQECT